MFTNNQKRIKEYGAPASEQVETAEDGQDINGNDGARSVPAENPQDGENDDFDDDDIHEAFPPGATREQWGESFPSSILAQIALKDLSDMFTFGENKNGGNYNLDLAQSGSMIPKYLNEQDCIHAIDYFEKNVLHSEKGCEFVDLTDFVAERDNDGECNKDEENNRMLGITNKVIDFFYKNYGKYLTDCEVGDIRMNKYVSNGEGYSGLHAETHYIDGKKMKTINENEVQVDYVGVVFLNDNFDGGDLQFIAPKAINSISAQTGNGVLFGGGLDYAHRVTPVTNGNRYVLRMVFNKKQ